MMTDLHTLIKDYGELLKPRILSLVLITATLGYYLGARGHIDAVQLIFLLAGVALVCGGSAALNHYLERDADSRMDRTRNRPLVRGVITPNSALCFGIILILSGVFLLYSLINLLTAFLSLLTAFLYVLVYTPMKRVSWLNTSIGAIPGALPPMGGWAAARGEITVEAWVLFLILYFWQHPHFYSIAWMFKDDYRQAGFKMLPVVDPSGHSTFRQINGHAILLLIVSAAPVMLGMAGPWYLAGVLLAGVVMFGAGLRLTGSRSHSDARQLLRISVYYLPILLGLIIFDSTIL